MKWYIILLIVVACIAMLMFCIVLLMHRIVYGRAKITDETINRSLKGSYLKDYAPIISEGLKWFKETPKEEVFITSVDGLKLKGYYFSNPVKTNKVFILVHGFRSRCDFDFSVGGRDYFLKGFNVLYIVQRAHQDSEGKYITFGIKERYDVQKWIEYIDFKFDGQSQIMLSGISMGSATVMFTLGLPLSPSVKGAICDCGYTSPLKIAEHGIKTLYHVPLPAWLVAKVLSFVVFLRTGKFLGSVHAKETLKNCKVPVLFIHGDLDTIVPVKMTEENYQYVAGQKDILIVKGAHHGLSYLVATSECQEKMESFINKCLE